MYMQANGELVNIDSEGGCNSFSASGRIKLIKTSSGSVGGYGIWAITGKTMRLFCSGVHIDGNYSLKIEIEGVKVQLTKGTMIDCGAFDFSCDSNGILLNTSTNTVVASDIDFDTSFPVLSYKLTS